MKFKKTLGPWIQWSGYLASGLCNFVVDLDGFDGLIKLGPNFNGSKHPTWMSQDVSERLVSRL